MTVVKQHIFMLSLHGHGEMRVGEELSRPIRSRLCCQVWTRGLAHSWAQELRYYVLVALRMVTGIHKGKSTRERMCFHECCVFV